MTSDELLQEYRDLTEAGASSMLRREAYSAYFRQACREGRPPDMLERGPRWPIDWFNRILGVPVPVRRPW